MANTPLSLLLGDSSFRVYDEFDNRRMFPSIAVTRVEIPSESQNADRPISNIQNKANQTYTELSADDIASSKIITPVGVRVTAFVPDISTLTNIIFAWQNQYATFTVMSKRIIAENMTIVDVQVEQRSEVLSAQRVMIEFEQAIVPTFNQFDPNNPADSSVYGLKIQAPQSVGTTLAALYNKVSTFIGI